MNKWEIIQKISDLSNRYGDLLVEMLDSYGRFSLLEITDDEVTEFWNGLKGKEK